MNYLIRVSSGFLVAAVVAVSAGAVAAPGRSDAAGENTRNGILSATTLAQGGAITEPVNTNPGRPNEQSDGRLGNSHRISSSLDVPSNSQSSIDTASIAYDEGIPPDEEPGGVAGADTTTTAEAYSPSSSAPTSSGTRPSTEATGPTSTPSTTSTSTLLVSSTSTSTLLVSSTTALLTVDDGSYDAVVRPGDSIQAVVDGLPAGSRILIGSGVHVGQQVEPKRGMTFVGEKGAVLDGGGSTNYAFLAWEGSGATDVTIRGLEIRNYKPLFEYHGAIMVRVTGWIVEDCDINNNAYSGVYVSGESIVRNCYIHRNGRLGVKVGGGSRNTLIENNEIAYNNINNVFDPTWEAGGLKVAGTSGSTGLVIRGNNVHDNRGPGIWIDVGAVDILIEDNLVENNDTNGIDYEISSYGVIRNNTVRNNGYKHPSLGWMWGAGITIRGSNVEVYGNTVENNYNGIGIIDTGRPNVVVDNINVYNNTVTGSANWQTGAVPGASNPDDGLFSRNIRFENNTYDGGTFRWLNTSLTLAEWQAFGHDTPN